jgi:hypothetical protein
MYGRAVLKMSSRFRCDYYRGEGGGVFKKSLCDSELYRMTNGRRRTYTQKYSGMEVFKTFNLECQAMACLRGAREILQKESIRITDLKIADLNCEK